MSRLNLSTLERAVRIALGLLVLAAGLLVSDGLPWWGWLGILPLATGLAGICPLWDALGISTLRARTR
ncbi:MAG: YgaP family membrane protein [Gemmatirosa sp.]